MKDKIKSLLSAVWNGLVEAYLIVVVGSGDSPIRNIAMAIDDNGRPGRRTSTFSPEDNPHHCIVLMNRAKAGTRVRVAWRAVTAGGADNFTFMWVTHVLRRSENCVRAHVALPGKWPIGEYAVFVFVNDEPAGECPYLVS